MNKQSQLLQPSQNANVISGLSYGINNIIKQFQTKVNGLVQSAQINAQQASSKTPQISPNIVSNLQLISSQISANNTKVSQVLNNASSLLSNLAQQINSNYAKSQSITMNNNPQAVQNAALQITQNPTGKKAMSKIFNLQKYANQLPEEMGMWDRQIEQTPQFHQHQQINQQDRNLGQYQTHAQLSQALDSMPSAEQATQMLLSDAKGSQIQNQIPSLMQSYFQKDQSPEEKLLIAQKIFNQLYKNNDSGVVQGVETIVAQTMDKIKKIAENDAKIKTASKKVFNLSKTAQHAGIHNVQMYNAEQVHPSPLGARALPQSNYHTVERNKAYNFRIGDKWDIDFQALWRQNIMDKYSSAYRDADGNWVGGYINKRFQVDSWIPKENNMQLLTGQLRKQRPQSQGSMQSRMELYRNNKQKKFNFAEYKIANNKNNIKTAQAKQQMTSKELYHELQSGPYAWPGGYPKYFVTNDGGALSYNTVKNNFKQISQAINSHDNNGWYVYNVDINWEDPNLIDDHTGQKIQCAYCQDQPKNNMVTAQFNSENQQISKPKLTFKWAQQTVCQPQEGDVSDQHSQITDEGEFSTSDFRQMFDYLKRYGWRQQNPSNQPQIFWKQPQQDMHSGCYVGSRGRVYGDQRYVQKFIKAIQGKLI